MKIAIELKKETDKLNTNMSEMEKYYFDELQNLEICLKKFV